MNEKQIDLYNKEWTELGETNAKIMNHLINLTKIMEEFNDNDISDILSIAMLQQEIHSITMKNIDKSIEKFCKLKLEQ